MIKKKLLIVNYNMIVGGSTTSLLSFLNAINKEKYEVDLLLYKNEGPLFDLIPEDINILRQAFKYEGVFGKIIKYILGIFSGYLFRAKYEKKKLGINGYSAQIMSDFQAKFLSRKLKKEYDFAIGYLEGWADRYVAYKVSSKKKYAWLHSTFDKIAENPFLEKKWMNEVDKIICVAENCRVDFCKKMEFMTPKSLTIENILDEEFIRKQSKIEDGEDFHLKNFKKNKHFKIISVCRLSIETKGLDRVISTAKKLVNDKLKFCWYIVGEGSDRKKIEELITKNNLQNYVVLTGRKINPYPFLLEADIMCMPSRWEGKPMTVIEAMALGTPCIVTNYLSAKEQIKDGLEGIIVENTENSIYPVLKKCIENTSIVKTMESYLSKKEYGNKEYIKYIEKELLQL